MEIKELGKIQYLTNEFDEQKSNLIFLHGFPDNLYVWKELADQLKDQFNILILGAPGCYEKSNVTVNDFKLEDLSHEFFKVIQLEMGANHKTIISHDMGGGYAHELVGHLGIESKLVCINTLPGQLMLKREEAIKQMLKSSYMLFFQLPLERIPLLSKYWRKVVAGAHKKGLGPKDIPKQYNENILKGFLFYKAMFRSIPKFLSHHKYQNPTLFIWGTQDPFLIAPSDTELDQFYFDWNKIELDCGHWPMLDFTVKIAENISQFVLEEHV